MTYPFTPEIVGWAQTAEKVYQIPSSLNLSAAFVESALGKYTPPNSNNWHGQKAVSGSIATTREQRPDGSWRTIESAFAVYPTPAASFMAYAHLLGLGEPYRAAVATFLKSARDALDVQALTEEIAVHYASALSYSKTLIEVQKTYNLYTYDLKPPPLAATPKETPMPFTFASLFGLLANAPSAITALQTGITDIESLLQAPAVKDLEAVIGGLFTHTTTAGAAAILEPKTATPGKA